MLNRKRGDRVRSQDGHLHPADVYRWAGGGFSPTRQIWYYHQELPAADRAVEAARAAGKDKECPAEFTAAEKMKNDAYEIYWSCRTQEGIAKANEASALAQGRCPA